MLLVENGSLTPDKLELAMNHKRVHGGKLGQALVTLGFLDESQVAAALQDQGRLSCLTLHPEIVDVRVASELGESASWKHTAVAINRIAGYTTVAMDDPQDVYAIDEIKGILGKPIFPVFAETSSIHEALNFAFHKCGQAAGAPGQRTVERLALIANSGSSSFEDVKLGGMAEGGSGSRSNPSAGVGGEHEDAEGVEEEIDEQPIVNLVRTILLEGFNEGASDIHLEPRRDDFMIRFRVDGVCYEKTKVPKAWASRMLVRIKLMANLDIAQRRLPQDGRAQFKVANKRVDLRVTTTPTVCGEGAVLRILDGGRSMSSLYSLGLRPEQVTKLQRIIRCREGFVLATGPTGSGKTTTLYALLGLLISEERKIITLEDPVENLIDGVTQINANHKVGLNFAAGLRSILRQDPDVVLVGEIRDKETAGIAVEASMTGHVVLSTLHTVGAVESVSRLVGMGVEGYLLGDTLRGIVAQRLLRKICPHCRKETIPEPEVLAELGITESSAKFYQGSGCTQCRHTGYKGRVGIYEILVVNEELRGLIQIGASTDELQHAAMRMGHETLRTEGLRLATAGEVTLADVLVVTI